MGKILCTDFVAKHGAELQEFFYEALMHGYGSDQSNNPSRDTIISEDGSTKIVYLRDDWRYTDIYYGGEPFSGITVIHYRDIACFTMVYWGKVLPSVNKETVYACLMPALMAANPRHPWRGPNQFIADNDLRYTNLWHGAIEKFYGQEKIGDNDDNWLYECDYRGDIVNLR